LTEALRPVFPSRIFSREAIFFLCRYHLLRQQDVAKWMPTKEKGRFARKNSLVENRLEAETHRTPTRFNNAVNAARFFSF
jgi:hypothetical protein